MFYCVGLSRANIHDPHVSGVGLSSSRIHDPSLCRAFQGYDPPPKPMRC